MGTKRLRLVDEVIGVCVACKNPYFFATEARGTIGTVYVPRDDPNLRIEQGKVVHLRMLHPEVGFVGELLGSRAPKPHPIARVDCGEMRFLKLEHSRIRWANAVWEYYRDADMEASDAQMRQKPGKPGRPSSQGIPL